jgi:hypothetical protein
VSRLATPTTTSAASCRRHWEENTRIIAGLVGDAVMPNAESLPLDLAPLADRQAVALRDDRWRADVDGLLRALAGEPAPTPRRRRRALPIVAVVVAR